MRALILTLLALSPAMGARAEAVWCDGTAPPASVALLEGARVSVAAGGVAPVCLNVPLPDYRKPFPVFCAAKPAGAAGAWCNARSGNCGPLPVKMSRHDTGRLHTAKDVRYCASFVNSGPRPVTVWLARPKPAEETGK